MESPVSATYLGIPGYVIFWALFAAAFGLFARRMYLLAHLARLGKKGEPIGNIGYRTKKMLEFRGLTVYGSPRPAPPEGGVRSWWLYGRQAVGYLLWSLGIKV